VPLEDQVPSTLRNPPLDSSFLIHLHDTLLYPIDESRPILKPRSLILALFGWESEDGHIQGLVTCKACFRRLGLWLFTESADGGTSTPYYPLVSHLDVILEHRDYCPWINASSQENSSSRPNSENTLPGWQVLQRTLRSSLRKTISEATESVRVQSSEQYSRDSFEGNSVASQDTATRKAKDEERWSRLKKIRKIFDVKQSKKPTNS
jgi:hypothetical protein